VFSNGSAVGSCQPSGPRMNISRREDKTGTDTTRSTCSRRCPTQTRAAVWGGIARWSWARRSSCRGDHVRRRLHSVCRWNTFGVPGVAASALLRVPPSDRQIGNSCRSCPSAATATKEWSHRRLIVVCTRRVFSPSCIHEPRVPKSRCVVATIRFRGSRCRWTPEGVGCRT
jgi:hypothetical protein